MNNYEKKKKAALVAVAYYIQQEKANANVVSNLNPLSIWARTGIEIAMNKRQVIQQRGRVLHRA